MRYLRRLLAGLLVAAAALLLAEGVLRVVGVAAMEPFFVEHVDLDGRVWLASNPQVGDNWFRSDDWEDLVRRPRPEWFLRDKPAGGFRALVLGESSAYGMPLNDNATWVRQLEHQLVASQDSRPVEVINLGLRAVTASVYQDVLPELLALEPDVVVLYAGHNEFYGVRPVGFPGNTAIWRLIEDSLRKDPIVTVTAERVGLRADDAIPSGGAHEQAALARFTHDLDLLVRELDGVPLLVYVVHGNERHLAPLCSQAPDADRATIDRADTLLWAVARAPHTASGPDCDLALLGSAPGHAGLDYAAGWCALNAGDRESSHQAFAKALDEDCVPVRARSSIRELLLGLPERHPDAPVWVVDPEDALRAASPEGVLGQELFYDHVHLTIEGSWVTAREGARELARHASTLGLPIREDLLPSYQATRQALHITPMDEWLSLDQMKHYYQVSVIRSVASRDWSLAVMGERQAALWQEMDSTEQAVINEWMWDPDEFHLAVAAKFALVGDKLGELYAVRAAVAAHPESGPLRRELALRLADAGATEEAREQAILAVLHNVAEEDVEGLLR